MLSHLRVILSAKGKMMLIIIMTPSPGLNIWSKRSLKKKKEFRNVERVGHPEWVGRGVEIIWNKIIILCVTIPNCSQPLLLAFFYCTTSITLLVKPTLSLGYRIQWEARTTSLIILRLVSGLQRTTTTGEEGQ